MGEIKKVIIVKSLPGRWNSGKEGEIFNVKPYNFDIVDGVVVVKKISAMTEPFYQVFDDNGNYPSRLLQYYNVKDYDRTLKLKRIIHRIKEQHGE